MRICCFGTGMKRSQNFMKSNLQILPYTVWCLWAPAYFHWNAARSRERENAREWVGYTKSTLFAVIATDSFCLFEAIFEFWFSTSSFTECAKHYINIGILWYQFCSFCFVLLPFLEFCHTFCYCRCLTPFACRNFFSLVILIIQSFGLPWLRIVSMLFISNCW